MTQRDESAIIERLDYGRRCSERVALKPAQRCIDVTPCCGPNTDHIMIDTYADRGALFITPEEAEELAAALRAAVVHTRSPQ